MNLAGCLINRVYHSSLSEGKGADAPTLSFLTMRMIWNREVNASQTESLKANKYLPTHVCLLVIQKLEEQSSSKADSSSLSDEVSLIDLKLDAKYSQTAFIFWRAGELGL